jgi:hypothetical protein
MDASEFQEQPHIGVAASFSWPSDSALPIIEPNPEIARFWHNLIEPIAPSAVPAAVWEVGNYNVRPYDTIARHVGQGIMAFCAAGYMRPGRQYQAYGDYTCFNELLDWDQDGMGENLDTYKHLDYMNPEIGSMVLFASTTGGTKLWYGGRRFKYGTNTQPSYARETRWKGMRCIVMKPNQIAIGIDARSLVHARDKTVVNNKERVLGRLIFGEQPE